MIDWTQLKTAEQIAVEKARQAQEAAVAARQQAYASESDPLRAEAEYDALVSGTDPDYSEWIAKVQEIKARHPIPVSSVE